MKNVLTTYEAAAKYDLTTGYIRRIMAQNQDKIKGRLSLISENKQMWLINAKSLARFMKSRPAPGRPKK